MHAARCVLLHDEAATALLADPRLRFARALKVPLFAVDFERVSLLWGHTNHPVFLTHFDVH